MSVKTEDDATLSERTASTIVINGGHALHGTVTIDGSKNAALPVLAAALLTDEECVFDNVPDLADVHTMVALLQWLGADVHFDPIRQQVRIQVSDVRTHVVHGELARKMRASFLVTGPLLARTGRMQAPSPGGCKLGERPLDVNVRGFETLGAHIGFVNGQFEAETAALTGTAIYLDYPSHTGTENLMMAATLAQGRTVIKHASAEPEIVALAKCLNAMGARISGAGTSCITIEGASRLHGVRHAVIPDRIEAGTFAIAAAMTQGDVVLDGVEMTHMDPIVHKLTEAGAHLEVDGSQLRVVGPERLLALNVQALPYPGFPTDLQAAVAALMTRATGESTIFERVYEDRLRYATELQRLGADMRVEGQMATIYGPTPLVGTNVTALDIRAGACLVLAGMVAEGTTTIHDIYHLSRGYEDLVGKLKGLGADIRYA